MKQLVQIVAKPLNYAKIKSDKSQTGEFIKITFLVEKPEDAKGEFYGSKKLDIVEIFDTLTDDYEPLMDKTIESVRLTGVYNNYKFTLTGFDVLKRSGK